MFWFAAWVLHQVRPVAPKDNMEQTLFEFYYVEIDPKTRKRTITVLYPALGFLSKTDWKKAQRPLLPH